MSKGKWKNPSTTCPICGQSCSDLPKHYAKFHPDKAAGTPSRPPPAAASETITDADAGFTPASELITKSSVRPPLRRPDVEYLPEPDAPMRTLADIEKEINASETQPSPFDGRVPGEPDKPPIVTADFKTPATDTRIPAHEVLLIKDVYRGMSLSLNEKFKCNDFPTDEKTLDNLENVTLKTLEYYKVAITPPVALLLVVFFAYGLPMLKHLGIIEKLRERFQKKPEAKKNET